MKEDILLFAKDIVTIDGVEYGRNDIDKIKAAFDGADGYNPFPPNFPSYNISGNHKVAGFDVCELYVEYDKKTGYIMDYILTTPYPFGAAVASLACMIDTAPEIFSNGLITSAEYCIDGNKKIVLGYMNANPSNYNIVIMWE